MNGKIIYSKELAPEESEVRLNPTQKRNIFSTN
jgi:hypothetical protein